MGTNVIEKNFIFASAQVKVISRSQFYPLYFEEIRPLLNKRSHNNDNGILQMPNFGKLVFRAVVVLIQF